MNIFLAGATGVIGRELLALLVADGHHVTATTRSPGKVAALDAAGGHGIVCNGLDRDAVLRAVRSAHPDIVVHELTRLPRRYAQLRKGTPETNRLRIEGTRNLVDAAAATGTPRVIAQSIAFIYAPGDGAADEQTPLWADAPGSYGATVDAVTQLEQTVLDGSDGVVLRYGNLYGRGTWFGPDGNVTIQVRRRMFPIVGSGSGQISWIHPRDAASATLLALTAPGGVYNIVDDEAVCYRDFLPDFATLIGAKSPLHVPSWFARTVAGPVAVDIMTRQRAATNTKAKTLGWRPTYPSWRDGFTDAFIT